MIGVKGHLDDHGGKSLRHERGGNRRARIGHARSPNLTRLRALLLLASLAATTMAIATVLAIYAVQPATPVAARSDPTVVSVHITRDPGLVVVPPVDRTISDRDVAGTLAGDIEGLPPFPNGGFMCPIDFGTSYSLVFST